MAKRKHIRWSKELVVEKIKELHSQGEDLNHGNVARISRSLVWAGYTYFGSWGKAIEAAGFDYSKIAKIMPRSKKTIIAEIRRLHRDGSKLNSNYMQKEHTALYSSGCNHFGNWYKAIEAAGFDYSKIRVQPPRRPPHSFNSKRKIVAEILRRQHQGLPLNGETVSKKDHYLYMSAMKQFGKKGWQEALKAAGLDPKALRAAGLDPSKVYKNKASYWNKERVREHIYNLLNINSPLYITFLVKNGMSGLFQAGIVHFGSWKAAIESCGLDYSKVRRHCGKKWTPCLIIDEIRILKQRGVRLNQKNVRDIRNDLFSSARIYFGSWGQAVEAAGFSYREESQIWSYKAWLRTLTPEQLKNIDRQALEFAKKGERL